MSKKSKKFKDFASLLEEYQKMALGGTAIDIYTPREMQQDQQKNYEVGVAKGNQESTMYSMLGDAMFNAGSSMLGSAGQMSGDPKAKKKHASAMGYIGDAKSISDTLLSFDYGGNVPGGVRVEVEGEEVAETPSGELLKFEGDSHENGGIKTVLPEGTDVFSKRLKKDGETLAKRKLKRETKVGKYEKLLEQLGEDSMVKNAKKRLEQANKIEEDGDKKIQDEANALKEKQSMDNGELVQQFAYGTKQMGIQDPPTKYNYNSNYGGYVGDVYQKDFNEIRESLKAKTGKDHSISEMQKLFGVKNDLKFGPLSVGGGRKYLAQLEPQRVNSPQAAFDTSGLGRLGLSLEREPQSLNIPNPQTKASALETKRDSLMPEEGNEGDWLKEIKGMTNNIGNALSFAGAAYSATEPMKNVIAQREGDTPNINAFEKYGEDALAVIQNTKDMLVGEKDKALNQSQLNATAAQARLRGGSRSINTLRAGDLAANAQKNKADSDISSNFSQQMMDVLAKETEVELRQDGEVMKGEQRRDEFDRRDRDNYYSQMAKAITNKGEGMQQLGKMFNKVKLNKVKEAIIKSSSGKFSINDKGEVTDKEGNVLSEKDLATLLGEADAKELLKTIK